MDNNHSQIAVMNLEEGEDIFAGRVTPHIPQVGIYKLLAKKKVDGTIEWAHFVQRDNGLKEQVMRDVVFHNFGNVDVLGVHGQFRLHTEYIGTTSRTRRPKPNQKREPCLRLEADAGAVQQNLIATGLGPDSENLAGY